MALKSIAKVLNEKAARQPNVFLSSSSSSSDGLVQICMTFTMVFAQNSSIFPLSSAPAHRREPGLVNDSSANTVYIYCGSL